VVTNRIYYTDPSCRTFDSHVTRAFEHDGRPAVTLDRTAFYPSSGGQPFDTGRLGAAGVVDTVDAGRDVIHVLSAALAAGVAVTGEVDWARRFDHMQQHTGQHVLSAAFDRLFDNRTVGFHMGADVSTIDLAREPAPAEVERAVDDANGIVWEDRPVSIRFVSEAEAASLPLRKESAREGTLRLIDISGFDLSACGGTHVERTGAIGVIAALSAERLRGGSRLTFACGGRALRVLRTYRDAVAGSVRVLSVLPGDLPVAVERVQAESKDLRKQIKGLQEKLAAHEGARLVEDAPQVGGVHLLVQALEGWDVAGLKALAAVATAGVRACVVLILDVPPASIVIACSAGVPVDANVVLQQLTRRFGGRGGGKPELAQGGGLTAPVQEIASAARALIESTLRGS
jgi:alanyl-tRNA synthetase